MYMIIHLVLSGGRWDSISVVISYIITMPDERKSHMEAELSEGLGRLYPYPG